MYVDGVRVINYSIAGIPVCKGFFKSATAMKDAEDYINFVLFGQDSRGNLSSLVLVVFRVHV
jgi:hypothetical protein